MTRAARIGVDIQMRVERPAALRWLARISGSDAVCQIEHWALGEAYWKATGEAARRPLPGEITFPRGLDLSHGLADERMQMGGRACAAYLYTDAEKAAAVVILTPGDDPTSDILAISPSGRSAATDQMRSMCDLSSAIQRD